MPWPLQDAGKLDDDPEFPDTQCTTRQQTDASQSQNSFLEVMHRNVYIV